jgi:uncharacterized NAD(P)/FAD-binding protein YdhS
VKPTTECDLNSIGPGRAADSPKTETVAIVGGGCAGLLVAAHLMRVDRRPRRIVIFEPRPELGAGVAYSTDDPRHLLNAPAGAMSALDDDPGHFVSWLAARHFDWTATDFVPRHLYREYLQDELTTARRMAAPGTQLVWVRELVTALEHDETAGNRMATVRYGQGRECRADRVVLALGAPASVALHSLPVSPTFGMVGEPWSPATREAMVPSRDVLILGTGLTMVDIAIVLADGDAPPTIHARSRRGLLPAEHVSDGFAPWPGFDIGHPTTAVEVLRRLRRATAEAEATGWNWRNVVAAARTASPYVWAGLDDTERRRLLRHLGRQWEVARHRMSPPMAAAVTELRRSGRLTVGAGRVVTVVNHGSIGDPRLEVMLAGSGGRRETLLVGAVIDCTGPGPDPTAGSPLVAGLVAQGLARIHPSGVGLDIDRHGTLLTASGAASRTVPMHGIGWCRRGAEFESTAVPEIRGQAALLARHISAAAGRPRRLLVHA